MWCILSNKIPTGANLQKRCFSGPHRYALCKMEPKDTHHLFLHCSVALELWTITLAVIHPNTRWIGPTINEAWDHWWNEVSPHKIRNLPILICWNIWMACIRTIFQDIPHHWPSSAAHILSIYHYIPDDPPPPLPISSLLRSLITPTLGPILIDMHRLMVVVVVSF